MGNELTNEVALDSLIGRQSGEASECFPLDKSSSLCYTAFSPIKANSLKGEGAKPRA